MRPAGPPAYVRAAPRKDWCTASEMEWGWSPHSCQAAQISCPFRAISKGIKPSFTASRVALLSNAREQPSHAQPRVIIYHPRAALRAPTWPRSRGALAVAP